MTWQDAVNGVFELLSGAVVLLNIRRLARDRVIHGIDWRVTGFFTAWGMWNLFYYPSLEQWLSFVGGLSIVAANCVWLALAFKYTRKA